MKYLTLASLMSLLLAMPGCNWNWRGRCVRPCAQPCATTCTAPCATSCEPCPNACAETVREVPLTYSAPCAQDGQYQQPSQQVSYQAPQSVEQDIDLDRPMAQSRRQEYYDHDLK